MVIEEAIEVTEVVIETIDATDTVTVIVIEDDRDLQTNEARDGMVMLMRIPTAEVIETARGKTGTLGETVLESTIKTGIVTVTGIETVTVIVTATGNGIATEAAGEMGDVMMNDRTVGIATATMTIVDEAVVVVVVEIVEMVDLGDKNDKNVRVPLHHRNAESQHQI